MNPQVIDDMSWAMAEVYVAVTDKLLVNLARHFKYTKTDNGGTFAYMAQKLAELGQVRKESVDIIMQNLTGADEMLRIVLENAIGYALKDVEPELKAASVKGMLNPAGMVPELTPNQTRAFKAYYTQSADKLNLVNTVMLESTEAAYQATVSDIVNRVSRSQSLLNIATGEVVSGASSWNSAVRDAVKGMVENGLTGFIDHGGHRWRPETYVAMDVRTTAFNTARAAVWERNESYGNDLYQVSSHNGARPLCYPWQGKVISSADASREVEDLDGNKVHVYAQSETSYGQAAGLFGVNCGHYPIPFIPGFSRLRGSGQSEEDNAKAYAESQEQRKLERKVRKEKLDLDVMKAQGASAEEIAAQKMRVRNAQADVSAFCEQTGRARHRDREFLPVDAKWGTEKALKPGGESGMIDSRKPRILNPDGSEAYRYPKSDVIQKMTSFDEINEYFSTTDRYGEKKYLFSGAVRDLPLENQKALAESVLYMQENFKPKEWPETISVQKTATVGGREVAGYYDSKSRKIVVSTSANKTEGELYLTGVHELIHHYDRYGTEAEYCVKQAEKEIKRLNDPMTGLSYSQRSLDLMRKEIAGDQFADKAELLAHSVDSNLSKEGQQNVLSEGIARLFYERNRRK